MANDKPYDPNPPSAATSSRTEKSVSRTGMIDRSKEPDNPSRRDQEIGLLQKANADLEAGYQRIRRQTELLEGLKRDGHDISTAVDLLATLQSAQQVMLEHRELILDEIERLGGNERERT